MLPERHGCAYLRALDRGARPGHLRAAVRGGESGRRGATPPPPAGMCRLRRPGARAEGTRSPPSRGEHPAGRALAGRLHRPGPGPHPLSPPVPVPLQSAYSGPSRSPIPVQRSGAGSPHRLSPSASKPGLTGMERASRHSRPRPRPALMLISAGRSCRCFSPVISIPFPILPEIPVPISPGRCLIRSQQSPSYSLFDTTFRASLVVAVPLP